MLWFFHFIVLLLSRQIVADDLQCLCNLAECNLLGNLCRIESHQQASNKMTHSQSESHHCYFQFKFPLSNQKTIQPIVYGCTHLISSSQSVCDHHLYTDHPSHLTRLLRSRIQQTNNQININICCSTHMCNHEDYVRMFLKENIFNKSAEDFNETINNYVDEFEENREISSNNLQSKKINNHPHNPNHHHHQQQQQQQQQHNNKAILFDKDFATKIDFGMKIAIVVVPVLGLAVVICLIFIAIQILVPDDVNNQHTSFSSMTSVKVITAPSYIFCCHANNAKDCQNKLLLNQSDMSMPHPIGV